MSRWREDALRRGDTIAASTVVRVTPERVHQIVSDVRRFPEWSPECLHTEWLDPTTFRGMNRRGVARWTTEAEVVTSVPGREFAFVVRMRDEDFTLWSYRTEPHPDGCLLTEQMQMCVDLPLAVLLFERVALGVRDRRTDLRGNIDRSLARIREVVESEPAPRTRS